MITQDITNWLKKYPCSSKDDYRNALQEIIQEIALEGLARAKFFEKAAFYGGTCLRILHQLDRFSEDLDFSLLSPDPAFQLEPYLRSVELHLRSYGFLISLLTDPLKENRLECSIRIGFSSQDRERVHVEESIEIKLKMNTNPALGFATEMAEVHTPGLFYVKSYVLSDLCANTMSAILTRREQGRDWYDLVWYVAKKIPLHLSHLERRLKQTAFIEEGAVLDSQSFSKLYLERVEKLDVQAAKEDVVHFIRDPQVLDIWSKPYFTDLLSKITFC